MADKKTLRKKYIQLRGNLTPDFVEEMSLQIANQALKLPIWNKTYYHIFLSIASKNEVNTDYLLHILQGKEKSIVVSKADFKTGQMKHFLLQDNTILKISKWGIPEPVSGIELSPEILDVVFVPLLAYDKIGHRIGYGKGFYDRFLKNCKKNTQLIGLSFFEPEPEIFFEATDVPLNFCVTPKKIIDFQNNPLSL
ncbi:5-formyltetrahydrofolate cyclo-ligase [Aequorivita sp. SDUM287046]|uniref:5-formyltetrahydrofolate cyclo-ligase n=1 Tax=Aequorivita aurantiaca TaxID=3053356 RepID=A0ABT8DG89_9FLAO|nr:5-formyltetrahydrofolate cyclo-ligase [Aequorivita aurantiaca]MDN3722931.1 5-formyltetrahydrofolate cyclo-ligase [Aequorivita aurantiaca]